MSTHYEELGVGKDASSEDIKRAYRKKASKVHPDRGGKTEDFQRLQKAYDVLIDPARRLGYDKGEEDHSPHEMARRELVSMFMQAVKEYPDPEKVDLIEALRKAIHNGQMDMGKQIRATQQQARKLTRIRNRLHARKGPDFIGIALEAKARAVEAEGDRLKTLIERGNTMLEILENFVFTKEEEDQILSGSFTTSSTWR